MTQKTQEQLEKAVKDAIDELMIHSEVPLTEFQPKFAIRMIQAMMVSFHKYGRVCLAYPDKFDAMADVRTRMAKYRETGDFWFLVDAANFAMIEMMHPRHENAHWGRNDEDTSPGRVDASTRNLKQEDNAGNRLGGDGFLHLKN